MTTQPAVAVGGETVPAEPTNAADVFTKLAEEEFGVSGEEEPAEGEPVEGEAEEADDETEIEEEADDLPPIDPPVSWDTERKEKFAQLPRDLQEYVADRESQRERKLTQTSQEAARAKTDAEQEAVRQLAQIEAGYSQHFRELAEQLQPQRPNPALAQHDPAAFYAQQAAYEDAIAQQRELQQRSQQFAQQAQVREQQAEQVRIAQERQVIVEAFPEYLDPTTGPKHQQELSAVARELGYPPELISQARATDIIAMKKVAELKAKADKYDDLQSKKMEKVRAAKGLPRVATPGVAQGSEQLRARTAQVAIETAKTSKNRDVQGQAFYDYLSKTGQIR
jgi:hypothetical protein